MAWNSDAMQYISNYRVDDLTGPAEKVDEFCEKAESRGARPYRLRNDLVVVHRGMCDCKICEHIRYQEAYPEAAV